MDREVGRTLAELERKLHELERALRGTDEGQGAYRQPPQAAGTGVPPAPEQAGAFPAHAGAGGAYSAPGGAGVPASSPQGEAFPAHAGAGGAYSAPGGAGVGQSSAQGEAFPARGHDSARLVDEATPGAQPGRWQAQAEPSPAGQPQERQAPSGAAWRGRPGRGEAAQAPAARPSDETIDLAELTRFRDRLEQTMRALIADYDRIISLRRAPAEPPREPR